MFIFYLCGGERRAHIDRLMVDVYAGLVAVDADR